MNVEVQEEWYSVEQCNENPNKLYVFGDNTHRYGKGGQAMIRDETNSYGIATKRTPSMRPDAFFGDTQVDGDIMISDIKGLMEVFEEGDYDTIVLPAAGLGTGLSKMPEYSPKLFKALNSSLSQLLNIDYNPS
jgi:hypothetical protein